MKEKQNVTIAVLAGKLGVSTATVAKALNGQGRISKATVQRVRDLARELNYVPNLAARSLRTNIKDAVGLLITGDITNPWYSELTSLLEEELSRRKLTMLLALGKWNPEKIGHALENFFGGRVRGIIAGPTAHPDGIAGLQRVVERGIPLVVFSNLEKIPMNFVAIDQEAGARITLEHLYQLGHRRITYFGGPEPEGRRQKGTRSMGYLDFMERYGLEPDYITFFPTNRQNAYFAMRELLTRKTLSELPTALLGHNDDVALGALLALQQAKIRVPEDISLTGFDNIAESSFCLPGLTTIGGVMETMAKELVNSLERVSSGENLPLLQKFIIPKLILRSTTSIPRKIC